MSYLSMFLKECPGELAVGKQRTGIKQKHKFNVKQSICL